MENNPKDKKFNLNDFALKLSSLEDLTICSFSDDFSCNFSKPLLVFDVDDVILDFHNPFAKFMSHWQISFVSKHIEYDQNFIDLDTNSPLSNKLKPVIFHGFFARYVHHLRALPDAVSCLNLLSQTHNIILLTKMPPEYHYMRLQCLHRLGIFHSLISTCARKSHLISLLGDLIGTAPLFFIDDDPCNINEVVADNIGVNLMHFDFHSKWKSDFLSSSVTYRHSLWPDLTSDILNF